MATMTSDIRAKEHHRDVEAQGRYDVSRRTRATGEPSWGLLVTGLTLVGVGILAWNYIGADLLRYLKIRSM